MKFKYFLDSSAGWAGIIVEIGAFSEIYSVSYIGGDNITSLLGGLGALLNQDKKTIEVTDDMVEKWMDGSDTYGLFTEQEYSNEEANITYDLVEKYLDENDIYKWTIDQEGSRVRFIFSLNNDRKKINLEIIEIDGDEIICIGEEECVFKGELEINELLDNVIESCDEILAKYGIIGYYENFQHEFPILNFLMLKDYRNKKLIFDDFTEICPHDKDVEMHRTNLEGEIEYLANGLGNACRGG